MAGSPSDAGGGEVRTWHARVRVDVGDAQLADDLSVPADAAGVVLFAHGSGSSRNSPRNVRVGAELNRGGLATLLMDLLTRPEEAVDLETMRFRFDIDLLARRVVGASRWLAETATETRGFPVGYFGASTGAAAALVAAAAEPARVVAVVSRGGRPDLVGAALAYVRAPTLLIVGELDTPVIDRNARALVELRCEKRLVLVPGATHLFEEPGTLDQVAMLARQWFARYLQGVPASWSDARLARRER